MAVVVTPQIEIDKYFESEALSQSVLKTLLGGLDTFLSNQEEEQELYYKEKGHFVIGSAVDCILTGQEGEFDKQYYVSQIEKKPSETEMSIIKMTFDDVVDNYAEKNDWIDKQFNDFPNSSGVTSTSTNVGILSASALILIFLNLISNLPPAC